MKTKLHQEDGVTTIAASGSVDALTAPELSAVLHDQVEGGHVSLVVDLMELDFMSSAGLRALLGGLKEARSNGGDLRIASSNPNIDKLLKMSGFHTIARVFPTTSEAVSSFGLHP